MDIAGLTCDAYVKQSVAHGASDHVARQIYRDAFRKGRHISLPAIKQAHQQGDTIKFTLDLPGGLQAESVIIPSTGRGGRTRNTLCVSSQVGCAMGCEFCETAQMGLMKNLTAMEIVGQWFAARFSLGRMIDNIVFMGMGEPMDNFDEVWQAIRVFADHNGPAIAASNISVSTVGRTAGIFQLAECASQPGYRGLKLAVSVNAPNDSIRSMIMPINRAEPMADLLQAMLAWHAAVGSRLLIEYVLIPGVNDETAHAGELCEYLTPLRETNSCLVNVIPYNPRRNSPWPAPDDAAVNVFVKALVEHGQPVRRRRTFGRDVMAACGQLGNPAIRRRRFIGQPTPSA